MSILTTCRLADPLGNHLIEIADYSKLDVVFNCTPGGIGVLELTLPTSFDTSRLRYDGRIGVWRSINGAPPYLDNNAIFLIQTISSRARETFVRAYHATQLMERRIISYPAGTAYTSKSAQADNVIKAFWRENAGALVNTTDRDGVDTQADISAYVSTQADLSAGRSVNIAAARRNLLDACREAAEASNNFLFDSIYVTFEIMAPTESTLELRTYTGARGVDHTASSGNPVVLSEARGNLANAELTVDYRDMATVAIGGGVGEGVNRLIDVEIRTPLLGWSPFARIERFVDQANSDDLNDLADATVAALRTWRGVTTFTAELRETPGLMRGVHFDLGDILTAEHPRTQQQVDVRLDVVRETIESGGRSVQVALRSVDLI